VVDRWVEDGDGWDGALTLFFPPSSPLEGSELPSFFLLPFLIGLLLLTGEDAGEGAEDEDVVVVDVFTLFVGEGSGLGAEEGGVDGDGGELESGVPSLLFGFFAGFCSVSLSSASSAFVTPTEFI
jgi:hypothetical protein